MIPENLIEIMRKDGVVAIATLGPDGPHMVNPWNSYLRISHDGRLFVPAGYMHKTEADISHNPEVLITSGSGSRAAWVGGRVPDQGKGKFHYVRPRFRFHEREVQLVARHPGGCNRIGHSNLVKMHGVMK